MPDPMLRQDAGALQRHIQIYSVIYGKPAHVAVTSVPSAFILSVAMPLDNGSNN